MKQNLYIFSDTVIKRKQNTLYFKQIIEEENEEIDLIREEYLFDKEIIIPKGESKYMPVENVESIVTLGAVHFNSRLLYFLSRNKIPVHILTYRGRWAGSFMPAEGASSAPNLINQVTAYLNENKKLEVAREIVETTAKNSLLNLNYYNNRGKLLSETINTIEELKKEIPQASDVEELFGIEGYIKQNYYSAWRTIFNYPIAFYSRRRNPPPDFINTMISFGNALLYSIVTNLIYQVKLYAEIGFMHSPGENKFSLSYDIADIYKPLIVDRTIFKLINKNMISEKDFFFKRGICLMKKETKKIFVATFEEKLLKKIKVEGFKKKISYKRLIKEDLYNLRKYLNGENKIEFYKAQW